MSSKRLSLAKTNLKVANDWLLGLSRANIDSAELLEYMLSNVYNYNYDIDIPDGEDIRQHKSWGCLTSLLNWDEYRHDHETYEQDIDFVYKAADIMAKKTIPYIMKHTEVLGLTTFLQMSRTAHDLVFTFE
tara:strand:- start:173455 stop:173847 length:393 start_codon:yes stop_codon:yes gene_type:complete